MNRIPAIGSQQIVDSIAKLGASDRIHKRALSDALKLVKHAETCKLVFSTDQAHTFVDGISRACEVLIGQNSKKMRSKMEQLCRLSKQFQKIYSRPV